MCRLISGESLTHCGPCGICLDSDYYKTHKCKEASLENPCPICLEDLKNSTKFITQMPNCSHWIHIKCLNKFQIKEGNLA